jgi:hypothetical protein
MSGQKTRPTVRQRRQVSYEWRLREVMAEHKMYATTELVPLLAERGTNLSASRSIGWSPAPRSGSRCRSWPRCVTSSVSTPPN